MSEVLFTSLLNSGNCAYLKLVFDEWNEMAHWSVLPIVQYQNANGELTKAIVKYPIYSESFKAVSKEDAICKMTNLECNMTAKGMHVYKDRYALRIEGRGVIMFWLPAEDCTNCVYVYDGNASEDCHYIVSIVDDTTCEIADQHSMTSFCAEITKFKTSLL